MNKTKVKSKVGEKKLIDYRSVEFMFKECPFCGNIPNVFQVPENRYGPSNPFGWVVECKSMGCIVGRTSADQDIKHLADRWNYRKSLTHNL